MCLTLPTYPEFLGKGMVEIHGAITEAFGIVSEAEHVIRLEDSRILGTFS